MTLPSAPAAAPAAAQRPGCWKRFKSAAKSLKREVLALYYAVHDPRTPWTARVLPFFVLAYALSPIDLIPDFIPILGILDDLLLLPGMIWLCIKLIPHDVMEDARHRAMSEPLSLHRNWLVATLILLMWLACIEWALLWALQLYAQDGVLQYQNYILGGTAAGAVVVFVAWGVLQHRKDACRREAAANDLSQPLL
jgi:uncharacterized membrane protein YkvA (DUF1232 family)